jgi:hypothetical protein
MKMEQILACALAKVNVMVERMDTNLREMKAEMRTDQEEMTARVEAKIEASNEKFEVLQDTLVSQMDIHQARTEAMKEKMDTHQESMEAKMDAWLKEMKAWRREMMACQEAMDTTDLAASREKLEAIAVHQEVPKEEAAVETIRAQVDQFGDWHLAVGCR